MYSGTPSGFKPLYDSHGNAIGYVDPIHNTYYVTSHGNIPSPKCMVGSCYVPGQGFGTINYDGSISGGGYRFDQTVVPPLSVR
ncbi:MAG: hypothetical protein AB1454_11270 [Candidatus Auribacterota bacterium]|jgi:hypothetical protein|uniref:Uncharacterized protein n=1 Tax=Candidatus Auribacter fodinae TaxID=2093366 RepID=A0A3A4QW15_9BACT|nr:MAG: hypothetical protein C4541_08890 [Candidatus Auribacter fodinae]